jgi:hypothetical protein
MPNINPGKFACWVCAVVASICRLFGSAASGCLGTVDEGWVRAFSGQAFESVAVAGLSSFPTKASQKTSTLRLKICQSRSLLLQKCPSKHLSFMEVLYGVGLYWRVQRWTRADPFILPLGKTILPHRRTEAGSTSAPFPTSCRPTTTCGPKIGCRAAAVACFVF